MKKKVLIVSRSFYPGAWPRAFRATELAKEFVRQGHEVKIYTHRKEIHNTFEKDFGVEIVDLGEKKWVGFGEKGNRFLRFIKKVANRLMNWLLEYPNLELVWLVSRALKHEMGYDLLISIAHPYPIHWGVAKALKKSHPIAKVWVADCGDPYMNQDHSPLPPPFYFGWVEKWFMRKADYITIPIKEAILGYYREFHHKIRVIPQGFRFEDIRVFKGDLPRNKVIFGYAGMFIPGKRDPSEFLAFLNTLDDSYAFEFHVYTHDPGVVKPFVSESKGRIKLLPVKPREEVLFELSKMHFVVNFENVGTKQSPSKVIDYGIIQKPVLGVKYKALDKANVLRFLKGDYSHKMPLPEMEQYKIENVVKGFLALI